MGQRLNIEIVDNGTPLANCYYHWSAYTESALELTKEIIDEFYNTDKEVSVGAAVSLLQVTGGGVPEDEKARIAKSRGKFHGIRFANAISRNDGLIAVTKEGMEKTRGWEEGRVTIDIGRETFDFDVLWLEEKAEYILDNCCGDEEYKNIPECVFDMCDIPFFDVDSLLEYVRRTPRGVREKGTGNVIVWIS